MKKRLVALLTAGVIGCAHPLIVLAQENLNSETPSATENLIEPIEIVPEAASNASAETSLEIAPSSDASTLINSITNDATIESSNVLPAETVEVSDTVAELVPVTEDQRTIQEKMMEYSTANQHHEFLKTLEGRWMAKVSYWMDPAGQPEVSEGISEGKMIMNGKFLEETYSGTAMGQPFEGRAIKGYDNLRKEYVTIWLDNMATGIMVSAGQYDAQKKTLTSEGTMSCPMTQETHRWMRDVMTFNDADNYVYETFMKDKDGKEYRSMEIKYSRVK